MSMSHPTVESCPIKESRPFFLIILIILELILLNSILIKSRYNRFSCMMNEVLKV